MKMNYTLLALAAMTSAASAATISINFGTQRQGTPAGSSTGTDGYTSANLGVTVTSWDYESFNDWSGDPTTFTADGQTIRIRHDAGGTWTNSTTPSDESVFRGYLDDNSASQNDIHLGGLAGWLAAAGHSSYKMTILRSTDNASGFEPVTLTTGDITGETGWFTANTPSGATTSTTTGFGGASLGPAGSSYTHETEVFSGSQDGLAITFVRNGSLRGSVAGVLIESVPEPSSAAFLGLGGLALILRRRK